MFGHLRRNTPGLLLYVYLKVFVLPVSSLSIRPPEGGGVGGKWKRA